MISLLKAIEKGVQWTKLGVHNCILSLFTCFLRLHVCFLSLLVSILVCWLPFLFISWVWWSMHITSKKQAKRALIVILWSLSLCEVPSFQAFPLESCLVTFLDYGSFLASCLGPHLLGLDMSTFTLCMLINLVHAMYVVKVVMHFRWWT